MLLDDLNNPNKTIGQGRMQCTFCEILTRLSDKEVQKLTELLDTPSVSKANLARILTSNGYKISAGVIGRHARKECRGFTG